MKKLIPLVLIAILGFSEIAVANDCFQGEEFNRDLYQKALATSTQKIKDESKITQCELVTKNMRNNNKLIHSELADKNIEIDNNFWLEEAGVLELEETVEIIDEQHKDYRTAKINIKNISHIDD